MIETYKIKQAAKIGAALAHIERGCDMLCVATGDNDIDGALKDALSDALVTAIDTLNLEDNGVAGDERDYVNELVQNTIKAVLKSGVAA